MFKLNPKQLERAMKQLGVKQEEIDATEVIIKTKDKDLIVKDPQVSKMNVMGQETLQIIGKVEERKSEFSGEDVEIVMKEAKCTKEEAESALKREKDIAAAILSLQ